MNRERGASVEDHRVVYQGRVFRVDEDRVRLPHGPVATMGVVRHRGSVVLIPQPDRAHVILIRQFRYVIGRWIWELPAGSLEPGETPARAARRECMEEIGWRPKTIRRVGSYYPTPGFCDERMVFYACTDLVKPARPAPADPDEAIVPRTLTTAEAWRLVARGQIVDMKTILGLVFITRGAIPASVRSRMGLGR